MKTRKKYPKTQICNNESVEAEPLMVKLRRMKEEGIEPDGVMPMIYTDKKDGVLPSYDIRTDRWQIMQDAAEKLGQSIEITNSLNENEDKASEAVEKSRSFKKKNSESETSVTEQ